MVKNNYIQFGYLVISAAILAIFGCARAQSVSRSAVPPVQRQTVANKDIPENVKKDIEKDLQDLQVNREKWERKNLHNYKLTLKGRQTGLVQAVRTAETTVKNDQPLDIVPSEPTHGIQAKTFVYEKFGTIDKMFAEIQSALETSNYARVSYNKEFGYPEKILIQYLLETDRTFEINVLKFEILK